MRSFAAVPPTVWQTDIKKLRGDPLAIAVYYHLTTSPHSTMIGIYPLDLHYLAIDLGTPFEGASEGLRRVIEAGLATYDAVNEIVWVHDMAVSQVAPRLSPKDNRVSAVAKQLQQLPICQITLDFYTRYGEVFYLREQLILDDFEKGLRRGFGGASEPLRSKEKDKDKEQDKDLGQGKDNFRHDDSEHGAADDQQSDEQEYAFTPPPSVEAGRKMLIDLGVSPHRMHSALQRLMREMLFPCDIEAWKQEDRDAHSA